MNETIELLRRYVLDMWHRRWIGLTVAWLAALIAIALVYRIPERYEATARVSVDTESLLKPLLSGLAVQPNIDQQVAMVSRTLISRPNVEKVVRMADMDLAVQTPAQRDQIVDGVMRSLKMAGNARGGNLYEISYQDGNPEQARKVVQSLITIFVESSLGDKRQDSRAAVRFLDEQIRQYEAALQAAENRLKEFRLRYLGMSQSGADYFARMNGLAQQIEAARLELNAATQARDAYRRELAGEQPTFIPEASAPVAAAPDTVPEIDGRLQQLRRELDEMSRKYTDNHPDVSNTRRIIGELEGERKAVLEERRKAAPPGSPAAAPLDRNPVFQQLRISMAEAEAQVASTRARLAGLEAQYAQLRGQARMVPEVEQEFTQLNRDYEVQKRTYETLLGRRESAMMGIEVQDTGAAQFRVIDPPRVGPKPVAPNRPMLLAVAFLASLGAGIAAAFFVSQLAPTFHDQRTLREIAKRPVLGPVSLLPTPALVRQKRRRSLMFAGGVSGLVALFAVVAAFSLVQWRTLLA